jgi:hypothetical protein
MHATPREDDAGPDIIRASGNACKCLAGFEYFTLRLAVACVNSNRNWRNLSSKVRILQNNSVNMKQNKKEIIPLQRG